LLTSPGLNAIVTGATGGLGYATAEGLARAGHRVVLTGRNAQKGEAALKALRRTVPYATAEFRLLDVASLDAVATFCAAWSGPVDILVNNAGVMAYPERRLSVDGYEMQFATNYLGHFALTLRLLPALLAAKAARVVDVSSLAHRTGRIEFDNLNGERSYSGYRSYGQSKLAMLLFARELQHRAELRGWPLMSIAAHPGWSATSIVSNGFGPSLKSQLGNFLFRLAGQSVTEGAKPILFAALDTSADPALYYGPANFGETRGPVAPARMMPQATDAAVAARLFDRSEQLTGLSLETVVAER
jgi:NAD(P)-dependent dehydrogenase (short-subunit alcohol dehydrogenase family)